MRQGGPSGRRPRGRHHSGGNGSGNNGGRQPRTAASLRHQTFDSNGPDVRVRGNAFQVYEKYLALARDAQGSGDRVLAESHFQHAEHYYRVTQAINEAASSEQQKPRAPVKQESSDQQPEVPSNYYAPDGQLMEAKKAAQSNVQTQAPKPEENKKPRDTRPPRRSSPPPQQKQAPDPFFAKDSEAEDQDSGPQKLVAGS